MDRKKALFIQQTGVNYGTAYHQLIRKLLYKLAHDAGLTTCCLCGQPTLEAEFTIQHKEPWLYCEDMLDKFLDVNNIGFAHQSCNSGDARHDTPARRRKANRQCKFDDQQKFCPGCELDKPLQSFSIKKRSLSGREDYCRECRSTRK